MQKRPVQISSTSNPAFRHLLSLEKSRNRREEGLTSVEGLKEIEMALESGIEFRSLFYLANTGKTELFRKLCKAFPEMDLYEITNDLYAKTAYRESTGGMIAVVSVRTPGLRDLKKSNDPLYLILSGVEKPGNIGAMFRTADAAALDAVICCDLPGDLYNPNTIRASLGTVFTVPVVICTSAELMQWLRESGIKTFCTNLHKAVPYHEEDYTGPSAIIMGTEATGVSEEWMNFADRNVKIPMLGHIDSMNVSVAAAIMVFEAKRQRNFRK